MNPVSAAQRTQRLDVNSPFRVVFFVQSFEECRFFYEKIVGLSIDCEWDHRPEYCGPAFLGVVYNVGPGYLELLQGGDNPPANAGYLYIPVSDVDAVWEWLSPHAQIVESIQSNPWGHRNFTISDPAGIKLKFFSDYKKDGL